MELMALAAAVAPEIGAALGGTAAAGAGAAVAPAATAAGAAVAPAAASAGGSLQGMFSALGGPQAMQKVLPQLGQQLMGGGGGGGGGGQQSSGGGGQDDGMGQMQVMPQGVGLDQGMLQSMIANRQKFGR